MISVVRCSNPDSINKFSCYIAGMRQCQFREYSLVDYMNFTDYFGSDTNSPRRKLALGEQLSLGVCTRINHKCRIVIEFYVIYTTSSVMYDSKSPFFWPR
jgi:hypothetical protein